VKKTKVCLSLGRRHKTKAFDPKRRSFAIPRHTPTNIRNPVSFLIHRGHRFGLEFFVHFKIICLSQITKPSIRLWYDFRFLLNKSSKIIFLSQITEPSSRLWYDFRLLLNKTSHPFQMFINKLARLLSQAYFRVNM